MKYIFELIIVLRVEALNYAFVTLAEVLGLELFESTLPLITFGEDVIEKVADESGLSVEGPHSLTVASSEALAISCGYFGFHETQLTVRE